MLHMFKKIKESMSIIRRDIEETLKRLKLLVTKNNA